MKKTRERNLQNEILLATSAAGATVFRCNTGVGWAGRATRAAKPESIKLTRGDVLIRDARPLHAGLIKGGSDVIGWTPVEITPDMVGHVVAVFTAIECKVDSRQPEAQSNFIETIKKAGGFAGFAQSVEDALRIIGNDS